MTPKTKILPPVYIYYSTLQYLTIPIHIKDSIGFIKTNFIYKGFLKSKLHYVFMYINF